MKHVFIAGATGYLGRYLCAHYQQQGWHVTALARRNARTNGLTADRIIYAEATWPESLQTTMQNIDLVISALGITHQSDGLGYWDVDYQANLNLLMEAKTANVPHFAYMHVLNADRMANVPMVAAKAAFVRDLQASNLKTTVIAPTGYFTDMRAFLSMAKRGRIWLFGNGQNRINPIHGADLAAAVFDAVATGTSWADIGGPETFTQTQIAQLCFEVLQATPRITYLPDGLRKAMLRTLPVIAPRRIAGPAQFFLNACAINMTAPPAGSRRLGVDLRAALATRYPNT